jgi:hypothetical protein
MSDNELNTPVVNDEDTERTNIVRLSTIKNLFTHRNVMQRAHYFACGVLQMPEDSLEVEDNVLYKPMKKLCYSLLTKEYNYIRDHIRIFQKRRQRKVPTTSSSKDRKRALTRYTLFCRDLHSKFPHDQIVGKIQKLWEEEKKRIANEKGMASKRPKPPSSDNEEEAESKEEEVKSDQHDIRQYMAHDSDTSSSDDDDDEEVSLS